jgi:chaperonin GroES
MKILGNRILIQPTEPIDKLESGLFLPQSAVQKPNTGTVIVVGTQADALLEGKTVLYNPVIAIAIIDGNHLIHPTDIKFIL